MSPVRSASSVCVKPRSLRKRASLSPKVSEPSAGWSYLVLTWPLQEDSLKGQFMGSP